MITSKRGVRSPYDASDIDNYSKYLNQFTWNGIVEGQNIFELDQNSFADVKNVYVDDNGTLLSRPSLIQDKQVPNFAVLNGYKLVDELTLDHFTLYISESRYIDALSKEVVDIHLTVDGTEATTLDLSNVKYKVATISHYIICFNENPGARVLDINALDKGWQKLTDLAYVPVIKRVTEGQTIDYSKDKNYFNQAYAIEYIWSVESNPPLPDDVKATVTITTQYDTFEYVLINANEITEGRIVRKINYEYTPDGIFSVAKNDGNRIAIAYDDHYYFSFDGGQSFKRYTYPKHDRFLHIASISDDGQFFFFVSVDAVYRHKISDDTWTAIYLHDDETLNLLSPSLDSSSMSLDSTADGNIFKAYHFVTEDIFTFAVTTNSSTDGVNGTVCVFVKAPGFTYSTESGPAGKNGSLIRFVAGPYRQDAPGIGLYDDINDLYPNRLRLFYVDNHIFIFLVLDSKTYINDIYGAERYVGYYTSIYGIRSPYNNSTGYFKFKDMAKLQQLGYLSDSSTRASDNAPVYIYGPVGIPVSIEEKFVKGVDYSTAYEDNRYVLTLNLFANKHWRKYYVAINTATYTNENDTYYDDPFYDLFLIDKDTYLYKSSDYDQFGLSAENLVTPVYRLLKFPDELSTPEPTNVIGYEASFKRYPETFIWGYSNGTGAWEDNKLRFQGLPIKNISKYKQRFTAENNYYYIIVDNEIWTNKLSTNDIAIIRYEYLTGTKSNEYKEVPDITYSDQELFLAFDNKLQITTNKPDDINNFGIKFYLPSINDQAFVSTIGAMINISTTDVAIFFNNQVTICSKVQDENLGTYYTYNKSRLSIGVRPKDSVINTLEGQYTVIPTRRGLAFMSYQQFVATTDQTIVYATENIETLWTKFYDESTRIEILQWRDYLVISNGTKELLLLQMRDSKMAWWRWEVPLVPTKLLTDQVELKILLEMQYVFRNTERYIDIITPYIHKRINWLIMSQPLHFGAPTYYKSIRQLIFQFIEATKEKTSILAQIKLYRKRITVRAPEVVDFKVEEFRTFVKRFNYWKINELQWALSDDAETATPAQLKLNGLTIKYEISAEVK